MITTLSLHPLSLILLYSSTSGYSYHKPFSIAVNTDYQGLPQVIEFTSESTLTVSVTLLGDSIVEGDEWFLGHLRGVINRGVIINKDTVNITIEDDDSEYIHMFPCIYIQV